jgi:hypothetical protein
MVSMGDSYVAIVDLDAHAEEAKELANCVISKLAAEKLIDPINDLKETIGGKGGFESGVRFLEVASEKWVNFWAIPVLVEMECPQCNYRYSRTYNDKPDSPADIVMRALVRAMGDFLNGNPKPMVQCSHCKQDLPAALWKTAPHLGFSNLAFVFWN